MVKRMHVVTTMLVAIACALPAQAQWVSFTNETSTRLVADPSVGVADLMERSCAVGDFDQDGWTDLAVARKTPYSVPGGKRGVLFMNEHGVLVDRTLEKASASDIPSVSMGMLDLTSTRDIEAVDVNNDGWLDLVTAADMSDGLAKHLGHPRVYINLRSFGGVWQGFQFENARIPQLVTVSGLTNQNPRFNDVAAGDVTGDEFADLYFSDHDSGQVGPPETAANDFNNRLLVNDGNGFFIDASVPSMGAAFDSPMLKTFYGVEAAIADFNNDGANDVARVDTLGGPSIGVKIAYNSPIAPGSFTTQPFSTLYMGPAYGVSAADLNNDGRMDVVIADDGQDRVGLTTGTTIVSGFPVATWALTALGSQSNGFQADTTIADLNGDGFDDFIITDVDEDTYYLSNCASARRTYIYRNNGGATFTPDDSGLMPVDDLKYLHDVAALDINGDCRLDLVMFQTKGTPGVACGAGDTPGAEVGQTKVFINNAPTGACPLPPCAADLDHSSAVTGVDLAQLLAAWTGTTTYAACPPYQPADFNQDCRVNGLDLAQLLAGWGPCP